LKHKATAEPIGEKQTWAFGGSVWEKSPRENGFPLRHYFEEELALKTFEKLRFCLKLWPVGFAIRSFTA